MGCGSAKLLIHRRERSSSQVTIDAQQRAIAAYRRQRIARDRKQSTYLRAEVEVEKALTIKRNSLGGMERERRPSYVQRFLEDLAEAREEGHEAKEETEDTAAPDIYSLPYRDLQPDYNQDNPVKQDCFENDLSLDKPVKQDKVWVENGMKMDVPQMREDEPHKQDETAKNMGCHSSDELRELDKDISSFNGHDSLSEGQGDQETNHQTTVRSKENGNKTVEQNKVTFSESLSSVPSVGNNNDKITIVEESRSDRSDLRPNKDDYCENAQLVNSLDEQQTQNTEDQTVDRTCVKTDACAKEMVEDPVNEKPLTLPRASGDEHHGIAEVGNRLLWDGTDEGETGPMKSEMQDYHTTQGECSNSDVVEPCEKSSKEK